MVTDVVRYPTAVAEVAMPSATVITILLAGKCDRVKTPTRDNVAPNLRHEDAAFAPRATQQTDVNNLALDWQIARQKAYPKRLYYACTNPKP
jgi:hypothetical protein